jgi:hypothetical protein
MGEYQHFWLIILIRKFVPLCFVHEDKKYAKNVNVECFKLFSEGTVAFSFGKSHL